MLHHSHKLYGFPQRKLEDSKERDTRANGKTIYFFCKIDAFKHTLIHWYYTVCYWKYNFKLVD